MEEELKAVNSESKKKEKEVASLKEKINEKDKEIQHIREQRNKLAKGECESQLAFDIMYKEAEQGRQNAVERYGALKIIYVSFCTSVLLTESQLKL